MLRVCLIGPGDIDFHYSKLLKIKTLDFEKNIEEISKVLVNSGSEIVLLPGEGVSFEIAKKYKELGGKKAFATVPKSDSDFGIKHLQEFIGAEINGKKVFDEEIDTGTWYKNDHTHCLFGDIVLVLGISLGTLGELSYSYYLYKLLLGKKPNVSVLREKIHPKIVAGSKVPFTAIVFKPFVKKKLPPEMEAYIKDCGGKVFYADSASDVKEILEEFGE
ncbi:MAG: hypothetical protein WC308_00915 [archaeon]|jgi:hypothetical protein